MTNEFTTAQLVQARQLLELALGSYRDIRREYERAIKAALAEFFYVPGTTITRPRKEMTKAMATAFVDAYEQGFLDGGGVMPMSQEASSWLGAKQEAEMGWIRLLFETLKTIHIEGDQQTMQDTIFHRSTGYLATLDGVYNEGRLRGLGRGNKMLTFGGLDGMESCADCRRLKGKRHRARWWIEHGLIPGEPGNPNFECHGYRCQHFLFDDQGNIATI